MELYALELVRIALPLTGPFRTSFGTELQCDILPIRAITSAGEGWGECVAGTTPGYSSEFADSAQLTITRFLAPPLFETPLSAGQVADRVAWVRGHRMAKAAVEMAVLDAELRGSRR